MGSGNSACSDCPVAGLNPNQSGKEFLVALAGNPNTGKSTLFNALTGLHQHTGNWPGKTVTRAEGFFNFGTSKFKIVDLPGTYSLLATSLDEEVARDFILFGRPDVTVITVDSTQLERNLVLVLQVLEITGRAVLALNLMDETKRLGIRLDPRGLARELKIPVVPMTARENKGLPMLLEAIAQVASSTEELPLRPSPSLLPELASAVEALEPKVRQAYPGLPNPTWVTLRLLEGDAGILKAFSSGDLGDLRHGDSDYRSKSFSQVGGRSEA